MKSDPKECLYCQNNETLHNLMIEIAQLSVSRVDRKSTRLNSSHNNQSRMPSSA